MIARDEEPATVELRCQRQGISDRPERDIAEVEHDVGRSDFLIPSTDELGIHLWDRCEWANGKLADPCMTEVRIGCDVIDLVEVERRILLAHRLPFSPAPAPRSLAKATVMNSEVHFSTVSLANCTSGFIVAPAC